MKRIDFTRALGASGFGALAAPAAAQTTDLTPIRLGTNVNNDSTPLFWAVTSGMFARAGLKVDIQKFNSGTVAIAALVGGSLDIARGSLLPLGRSTSYTNSHHAEVLATVAPFWGVDPAVVNAMTPTVGASQLDPHEIQPLLDAALRYGVIPAPITAKSMIAPGVI